MPGGFGLDAQSLSNPMAIVYAITRFLGQRISKYILCLYDKGWVSEPPDRNAQNLFSMCLSHG